MAAACLFVYCLFVSCCQFDRLQCLFDCLRNRQRILTDLQMSCKQLGLLLKTICELKCEMWRSCLFGNIVRWMVWTK
jgi:hypothetical protein